MKKRLKNLISEAAFYTYMFPSTVGRFIIREPIRYTAIGIAKYGKVKSERGKKILGGITFIGDVAGLVVSAFPFVVTVFPYIWKGNDEKNIYRTVEEIVEKNRED